MISSSVLYGMSNPTFTNARKEIYEFGNSNGLPSFSLFIASSSFLHETSEPRSSIAHPLSMSASS